MKIHTWRIQAIIKYEILYIITVYVILLIIIVVNVMWVIVLSERDHMVF